MCVVVCVCVSVCVCVCVCVYTVNPNKLPELKKFDVINCLNFFKLFNLKVKIVQNLKGWMTCYLYLLITVKLKCSFSSTQIFAVNMTYSFLLRQLNYFQLLRLKISSFETTGISSQNLKE